MCVFQIEIAIALNWVDYFPPFKLLSVSLRTEKQNEFPP